MFRRFRWSLAAMVLAGLLLVAGCTQVPPDELSRESGRRARQAFDAFMEQAGEFVAGFCAGSPAPVALAVAGAALSRRPLTARRRRRPAPRPTDRASADGTPPTGRPADPVPPR